MVVIYRRGLIHAACNSLFRHVDTLIRDTGAATIGRMTRALTVVGGPPERGTSSAIQRRRLLSPCPIWHGDKPFVFARRRKPETPEDARRDKGRSQRHTNNRRLVHQPVEQLYHKQRYSAIGSGNYE